MYQANVEIRVRYAETDQMGYVYHGNYAAYFEVARTEAFRQLGIRYRDLEEQGVGMPVGELHTRFRRPARYDDLLLVKVMLRELATGSRVNFEYEITNEAGEMLTTGHTLMVFVSTATGRPVPVPSGVRDKLAPYFADDETESPLGPLAPPTSPDAPAPAAFGK
jgi:acyl-CoA thioester hydrolase